MKANPHPVMIEGVQFGWACPDCKVIFQSLSFEELARDHCHHACEDCGVEKKRDGWVVCQECLAKREEKKERERFEKAEKVPWETYEGFVYDPNTEKFFDSVNSFLDEHEGLVPEYVWACTPEEFTIDAQNVVETALSNHYEEAGDVISSKEYDVLQALLDDWAKRQGIRSWDTNTKRAVVFVNKCEKCGQGLMPLEVVDGCTKCAECLDPKGT